MSESRDDSQPGDGEPQGSTPEPGGSPSHSSTPQDSVPLDDEPHSGDPWSSATRETSPPPGNGQARTNGQSRANGQARTNGQPGGRGSQAGSRGSSRGSDPVADFQRWMMKAGARSMANQVADQVKRTIGAERKDNRDVWNTATNEPPPTESPECQWCPICQAARAARTGNTSGLSARLADAGGALAGVVEGAFSAFEQVLKTQEQNRDRSAERPGPPRPGPSASDRGETGQ
ncbi:MAG TPA: hypothetical protein VGI96_22915 [Streptosporangiaceae bacterium]